MQKVIVTGINGFIGSHLVQFLSSQTNIQILGIDIHNQLREEYFPKSTSVDYLRLDNFLEQIESFANFDCIFHVGALSSTTETNWQRINLLNIYCSKILIQFAVKEKIHLIFTSSASIYGHNFSSSINSGNQFFSIYAYSKMVIDHYIQISLKRNPLLKLTSLRLFNVFGNNERHKKEQASPYFKFRSQAQKMKQINLFYNSGDYLRDFISVDDVTKIMYKAFSRKIYGIYNLGTGKAVSFELIAQKIAQKYHAKINWVPMPKELKKHYQIYTKAENEDLLSKLGGYSFKRIENLI